MPDSDGRGTHPVREGRANRGALRSALLLALAAAPLLAPPLLAPAALAQDDPATQRGVPAEATAANAVVAKERAIANAQRTAWQRYAAATGQNPNASASQIESAVVSMVVEQERSTLNGYSGRYTIRFRGARSNSGTPAPSATASAPATPPSTPSSPPPAATGADAAYVPPLAGPATPPPGVPPILPLSSYVEAGTRFRSLEEWLTLRRRLLAQPSIGSVDILAISTSGARLRIGLRSPAESVAPALSGAGIVLSPVQPVPGMPAGGPAWLVGLAGGV